MPDTSMHLVNHVIMVGVDERTWLSTRDTLVCIGFPEAGFFRECDASFKQGTRFDD
jgi:hypothetical protein